MMLIRGRSVF